MNRTDRFRTIMTTTKEETNEEYRSETKEGDDSIVKRNETS